MAGELIDGRGVVLLRGLPVERYDKAQASTIYWGVGTHLGQPWPQNAKGHLLGDVTDQGRSPPDPTSRGNELGGVALPFHSDGSDLVGLFCLAAGADGGDSLVANAVTIHNDLVRDDPELAAALYEPLPYDFRGEQAPGARAWYTMPAFTRHGDRLFVRYIRPYIESSKRHADAPRPSARRPGGDGSRRRHVRHGRVPRGDGDRARRHAVRQQLPRAARTGRLPRRPRARAGCAT